VAAVVAEVAAEEDDGAGEGVYAWEITTHTIDVGLGYFFFVME
jgi:hypothetical protein